MTDQPGTRKPVIVGIGRLDNGSRFISKTEMDDEIFQTMMKQEMIGERGKVREGSP